MKLPPKRRIKSPPIPKAARERKIKAIYRDLEAKKRELGLRAPAIRRGPVFYLVVLLILGFLGSAILQLTRDDASNKSMDWKQARAQKSVDALAEALGRYKFHCGVYPTKEDGGLEALSRKSSVYDGWVGPYATRIVEDPWKRPYLYEPSTNDVPPVVLSLGADGVRGTMDDIAPDASLFTKPFRDTTWTNDWVPFWNRGIIVRPKERK